MGGSINGQKYMTEQTCSEQGFTLIKTTLTPYPEKQTEKDNSYLHNLIFVDVEGHGPAPTLNNKELFEFGAVPYKQNSSFHGQRANFETFAKFNEWLLSLKLKGRMIFVSDNPAYDWQFINYYFHFFLKFNPFGHSARRISDFYAGLTGDFRNTQKWKQLRVTTHDHHPVHDALGNIEAFKRILNGERGN